MLTKSGRWLNYLPAIWNNPILQKTSKASGKRIAIATIELSRMKVKEKLYVPSYKQEIYEFEYFRTKVSYVAQDLAMTNEWKEATM